MSHLFAELRALGSHETPLFVRALRARPPTRVAPRRGHPKLAAASQGAHRSCQRSPVASQVMSGMIRMATMLATLIIGLMAGPAVSLNGSPTVSPVTEAA
jgi:hypothetical protein